MILLSVSEDDKDDRNISVSGYFMTAFERSKLLLVFISMDMVSTFKSSNKLNKAQLSIIHLRTSRMST